MRSSFSDFEILVIDDCSNTDELCVIEKTVRSFDKAKIYYNEGKKGANACRNIGLGHASGDWIQFLDSDDLVEASKFELQISVSEEADVVLGGGKTFSSENSNTELEKWMDTPEGYESSSVEEQSSMYLERKFRWPTAGPIFRKDFIEGIGAFPESLASCQDWEFFLRVICASPRYARPPQNAFCFYRDDHSPDRMKNRWKTKLSRLSQIESRVIGRETLRRVGSLTPRHRMSLSAYFSALSDDLFDQRWIFFSAAFKLERSFRYAVKSKET